MGRPIAGIVLALALLCITVQVSGQLAPVSFGFPNAVQTSTTTAWEQDTANAVNYQNTCVNFPGGLAGLGLGGFPSISQTSFQAQSMSHTEFSQTTNFAAIGYPYVSVGPAGFACGM